MTIAAVLFRPLILLSLLALSGAASAQTVHYRGRVLDRVGMAPVVGASVSAGSLTVLTQADGRFVLQGNPTSLSQWSALPETPFFALQGKSLRVENRRAGQSLRLAWMDGKGRSLLVESRRLEAGAAAMELRLPVEDFTGFLRISLDGETRILRVTSVAGVFAAAPAVREAASGGGIETGQASMKRGTGGSATEVTVTMPKLVPRTLSPTADDADLGDIVLDYPPRKLGLGSSPPYGALVLFPAEGDSASARAHFESVWIHKMNSWRTSQGMGTTPLLWKVMADPESAPGSFKPSLSPCCQPRNGSGDWGYDDIITRKPFRDYQLHLEFNLMGDNDGNSDTSGWCNSGVYLTGSQELQIQTPDPRSATQSYWRLHDLATLINEKVPDRNMHLGPGKWQSYDVTWRAPRNSPGKVTVYWNGERIHNNVNWGSGAGNPVGFALQNEKGTDVRFRNVWIKELVINEAQTDFGY
jgi:hypothetical protein